jgi:hypothetical protein
MNKALEKLAWYVQFNRCILNGKNSSGMKWTIFRQKWQHVKYFGGGSRPISLDLAYILHITIIY